MKIIDMQGHIYDDTGGEGSPWALNEAWLSYQESELTRVLNRIDDQYSGRVMGLNIALENGGEWFFVLTATIPRASRCWTGETLLSAESG